MKISMVQVSERSGTTKKGNTVISANLKRESEMLDSSGNAIDPRTKSVLRLAEA